MGADSDSNTIIIIENGDKATYFFSNNSGKAFDLKMEKMCNECFTLSVKGVAGSKPTFETIADVRFFGQSPAQRKCEELKRHLGTLGYLEAEKKTANNELGVEAEGETGDINAHDFFQWCSKKGMAPRWSKNQGGSQESVFTLYLEDFKDPHNYTGKAPNKNEAKKKAAYTAAFLLINEGYNYFNNETPFDEIEM